MHCFFIAPEALNGPTAVLTGEEAHHLRTVLRLKAGERICLFDGTGQIHEAIITRTTKGEVETRILSSRSAAPPSAFVHISQAILKGKKMDLLVQKANELGIDVLEPFVSTYCENRSPNPERPRRWRRIIYESCKQCGRPAPMICRPEIEYPVMLAAANDYDTRLIFWEQEQAVSLSRLFDDLNRPFRKVQAVIGPEGGFSKDEIELAQSAGFQPVSLGCRTLRAETAGLAAMAILQHRLGNLDC